MKNLHDRIKKLNEEIVNLQSFLIRTDEIITSLEKKNRAEIGAKEKELEDWRAKLEVCQQERNEIKQEIKQKVKELDQSNLANTEKQEKINKLLTEHSQELEDLDNLISTERTQYRQIRNQLINHLTQPCELCREKDKMNHRLFVTNWTIIAIATGLALLFLGLIYLIYPKKKPN